MRLIMKNKDLKETEKLYYELTGYQPSKRLLSYLSNPFKAERANKRELESLVNEFKVFTRRKIAFLDGPEGYSPIDMLDLVLNVRIMNKPDLRNLLYNDKYKEEHRTIEWVEFSSDRADLSKEKRNITQCYYISTEKTEDETMRRLAINQINSNCREAAFYCTYENGLSSSDWHNCFDETFVENAHQKNIEITEENVLLTWDLHGDLVTLVDEIEINARSNDKDDVIYVFYGENDEQLLHYVVHALSRMEREAMSIHTPLCTFSLEDTEGEGVGFDITPKYKNDSFDAIADDHVKTVLQKHCDTVVISLCAFSFEVGKKYYFRCDKELCKLGEENGAAIYGISEDDKTLALRLPGSFKYENDKQCFSFEREDDNSDDIFISVGWMWNVKDRMKACEDALKKILC